MVVNGLNKKKHVWGKYLWPYDIDGDEFHHIVGIKILKDKWWINGVKHSG